MTAACQAWRTAGPDRRRRWTKHLLLESSLASDRSTVAAGQEGRRERREEPAVSKKTKQVKKLSNY